MRAPAQYIAVLRIANPPASLQPLPVASADPVVGADRLSDLNTALGRVEEAAKREENLMPPFIEAVKCYATLGEVVGALKGVYGEYTEPIII